MLDPHLVFHQLFTTVGLKIPASEVRAYWQHHRDFLREEWAVQSPASSEHIPIAIYGDSAKILDDNTKMIGLFISMPAVWRPLSTRCSRWCVFALEEHKLHSFHTLNAVFKRIVYSCNILFNGHDPDRPNLLIAGGQKFSVTELKGDWLWHKEIFRFHAAWNRIDSVCFRCTAQGRSNTTSELFYCMDNASWTEFDLASFLAHQLGRDPHVCALLAFDL